MSEPFGVYVHVPFCAHRCDYCAFATYTDRDHLMVRYVDACIAEIDGARRQGALPPATSVFFGGGTPSRLAADELVRLLAAIPVAPGAEVTVECNPEDAEVDRLRAYRDAGVTRMSFGIQSTRPHVLDSLGRRNVPDAVTRVADVVGQVGFASWNLDLIFGAADETDEDWACALDTVVGLDGAPPHISAYALTVEPGTPLGADASRHPDDDVQARRYEMTEERLSGAGYRWEEISNWAKPGHECRHNHVYWDHDDYAGFGSAAHSHQHGRRYWNVRTPDRYIAMVDSGERPLGGEEVLDEDTQQFERDSLALRTRRGVAVEAFDSLDEIAHLIRVRDGQVTLAPSGRLLANQVIVRLKSGG